MLQEILTYIILAVTVAAVLYSLFFGRSRGCGCTLSKGGYARKGGAARGAGASCGGCASCGDCPLCSAKSAHPASGADGTHSRPASKNSGKHHGR